MTPEESKQVRDLIYQLRLIWKDLDSTRTDVEKDLKLMRSGMSGMVNSNLSIIDKILKTE